LRETLKNKNNTILVAACIISFIMLFSETYVQCFLDFLDFVQVLRL